MADDAHSKTDKEIEKLEKKLEKVYGQAQADLQVKYDEFQRKYAVKDQIWQDKILKATSRGEYRELQKEYASWKAGQVFQSKQWQDKINSMTQTLLHANQVATSMVNSGLMDTCVGHANYMSYTMEHGTGINFGFDLYDRTTIEHLIKKDPTLLPVRDVNEAKDQVWNQKLITQQITQGILQGERLDQIAKRLATVTGRNANSMLTNARTAMTGAQNVGRMLSIQNAKKMGINVMQVWMATLDEHTRESHQELDGEAIKVGDMWHPTRFSNGCRYPADPSGPPEEVYNCRCTMVADVVDYPSEYERYDNIEGHPIKNMTYKEWYEAKQSTTASQTAPLSSNQSGEDLIIPAGSQIRTELGDEFVNAMETILNFTEEEDVAELFKAYGKDLRVKGDLTGQGAHYSPKDKNVHFDPKYVSNGDSLSTPYETAFHEFGHNIDYLIGSEKYFYGAYSTQYGGGALDKALNEDWSNFKIQMIADNPKVVFSYESDGSYDLRDMGVILRSLDDGNGEWRELSHQLRNGEITGQYIIDNYMYEIAKRYVESHDNYSIDRYVVNLLKEENMPISVQGNISDIIEGCTGIDYPLGAGHGADYHGWSTGKKYVVEKTEKEFFAEVIDSKAANPKALEQMRRVFPNSVSLVEQMIQEVLDKKR